MQLSKDMKARWNVAKRERTTLYLTAQEHDDLARKLSPLPSVTVQYIDGIPVSVSPKSVEKQRKKAGVYDRGSES